MNPFLLLLSSAVAYLLGALPSGFLMVRFMTGKDIRAEHSGRTGGTNVMRAAGFWAGLLTASADVLKGAIAVWLAAEIHQGSAWAEAVAGVLAVTGHNYSVFLMRREAGRWVIGGGAGGATTFGASIGLWAWSGPILLPLGALILFLGGYASVATMSVGALATLLFLVRALLGLGPWAHVAYGAVTSLLLLWALRPNIRRLLAGEERLVGLRARRRRKQVDQAGGEAQI